MATTNVFYAELMHDHPELTAGELGKIAQHMRSQAALNGPYRGSNTAYITDEQLIKAFAASYYGVKIFDGHIDYTKAGNSAGLTRAGSNPWTCEHKIVQEAGRANPPAEMDALQKAMYYWTVPFAAEKLDRPSQGKQLNKAGFSKSPFKGGLDLLNDLFSSVLDDCARAALKEKLKARTEENKKNGVSGWGGPSAEYCEKCEETAEIRGVNNMARNKATGIYARMTTAQDEQLSVMVARANFAEHATPPEVGKLVSEFIKTNCVDQEKLAAIEKERAELGATIAFVKTKESQQAKVPKLEAELAALNGKSAITTDVVLAVAGPATIAQMKAMLAQPKRLE